ncbi:class I fructose-bisphosphate aldolase [Pedosphaera parvula]|uniref:Probable fructose-bisphosphate aldolase class 1 n=1 Tax=Pedosphaera parvula (strain Ellin514) TaxID=320771 RepID=B9XNP1_PEDPL|nr:class I fructose-bisphosphate aldolase [Pedosphaera parvula]EEF58581.1 Fructose-bisphosphate aldolase [Pedosphaera parvula Ellin514]
MAAQEMEMIARALVAPNKGILAADESTGTIEKRFKNINVPNTEENRRDYRELLFTTPDISKFISGVILYDETIRQKNKEGTPLVEILKQQGLIPGIKVDKGAKPLAGFPGEKITEGLDGLRARFEEYYKLGARFSKWRAVITIGNGIPTLACIKANAHALACYAALSQEAGIVPIVEPEVLMDGSHTLQRCAEVTELTIRIVFEELFMQRVVFEQMLLKPNMVTAGKDSPEQASVSDVAKATIRVLRHSVPAAVPGIVFLSGGQNDILATEHLNAMNQLGPHPWQLSFSYGRALQDAPLHAWLGNPSNRATAQQAFLHRAECNGMARSGKYSEQLEAGSGNGQATARKPIVASASQD